MQKYLLFILLSASISLGAQTTDSIFLDKHHSPALYIGFTAAKSVTVVLRDSFYEGTAFFIHVAVSYQIKDTVPFFINLVTEDGEIIDEMKKIEVNDDLELIEIYKYNSTKWVYLVKKYTDSLGVRIYNSH